MQRSMSNQAIAGRTLIRAGTLAAAVTVLMVAMLACGTNQAILHICDCPDAGASDGGDAGDNGGGGSDDPACDYTCAHSEER